VNNKDVQIHEVVEEVLMKGPIELEQFSSLQLIITFRHDNIKLIF
jgi:hypothetical protein